MTDASPYLQPQHSMLLSAYWPEPRERAIRVAAVHRLLPDDADRLPGAAAWLVRAVLVDLLGEFPGRPTAELACLAEGLVHFALEVRAEGLPVVPARH